MKAFLLVCLGVLAGGVAADGPVTRIYRFEGLTPEEVEAEVRRYVPSGMRVLVNPEVNQVMVIADEETQERVSRLLERLDRTVHRVQFWFRHNRNDPQYLDLIDGDFANFPVTQRPVPQVEANARGRLPHDWRNSPLAGSVLETHFSVLRADPPRVRIRLTPAVLFGTAPPYEVVRFSEMSTDVMMTDEAFLDLVDRLSDNEFYRMFFRSRGTTDDRHGPVGLLLSLRAVVQDR